MEALILFIMELSGTFCKLKVFMSNIGKGTTGTILQGAGTGASPTFSTATYPSTAGSSGKILISDGTNIVSSTPTYPNAASTALKHIKSDGTNFVTTTVTYPDASVTAGKVIVSDGTNYIASTPTFPNASATTGKIIISDGTNWIASTPTYPAAAGTSGNVLTSDGTNWTSVAASSGGGFSFSKNGAASSPSDGNTYYLPTAPNSTWTSISASSIPASRFYIPQDCTLKSCLGSFGVTGTLGSAENVTIAVRKNDTSNTNVTTTLQLTANPSTFSNTALSTAFSAGDFADIVFIGPTWSTNPTNVTFAMTAYFSVP